MHLDICQGKVDLFIEAYVVIVFVSPIDRLLSKNVSMYEAVAQECSRLTRLVVDRQHVERKAVLSGIKRSQCRRVRLTHRWRELALVLTHERATWHSQHSHPRQVIGILFFVMCWIRFLYCPLKYSYNKLVVLDHLLL